MSYIIETRKPASDSRPAEEWHSDGMGSGPIEVQDHEEGHAVIQALRGCGPDWEAAEYRIVPKGPGR